MRLLIFSQYFWPESFIINDLARILRDLGHEVVVGTGKPNYPDGRIFSGYHAAGTQRELFDGDIEVVRVPLRPRGKGGALDLLRNYWSFVANGCWYFPRLLRGKHFDAILVFAGSPNVALPALPLRWLKKAHLALWVQDLWPESLSAMGYVQSRWLLRAVGWVVRFTYACADTILVQSQAFKAPVARYARADKVIYYPNSLDVRNDPTAPAAALPPDLVEILERHFCVVFAGNIGTAQAPGTLVEAASLLQDLPHVRLVMVGSGSMFNWVVDTIRERNLHNVVMAGRFPMQAMDAIFRRAGALIVSLKDSEIFSYTVPSKVQAYLAAGRPIVAALNGEGARIVREAGVGLTCAAEDPAALADAVRTMVALPESERARMGAAGRKYFMEHFEMQSQARRLLDILNERLA